MNGNSNFDQLFDKWVEWLRTDADNGVRHWYTPNKVKPHESNPRYLIAITERKFKLHEISASARRDKDYDKDIAEIRSDLKKLYDLPSAKIENTPIDSLRNDTEIGNLKEFKMSMFRELKRFEKGDRTVQPLDERIARQFGIHQNALSPTRLDDVFDFDKVLNDPFRDPEPESKVHATGDTVPAQQIGLERTSETTGKQKSLDQYDLETLKRELERTKVDDFDDIVKLEEKYRNADLKARETVSFRIERGAIAEKFKRIAHFKCLVCEHMGLNPYSFKKRTSNEFYVEAHHVIPVSNREVGTLSTTNIITVCANHHRQIHHGNVVLVENTEDYFLFVFEGDAVGIPKIRPNSDSM